MVSKPTPSPLSVTDRYLAALLAQPTVSTITLADGKSIAVQDVYVPRTLLHEVSQKESAREPDRGHQARAGDGAPEREITVKLPVELWPKLRDERVVVVEGPAGIGKSTLTKQLVRESRVQRLIPIWIPFRLFVASGLSLAEYLDQHYVPWLGLAGLRVPYRADGTGPDRSLGQWLYEQWQSGFGGLLILDGLDEVFRHDERITALRGLPITGTGATRPATILTSRPLSQSVPLKIAKVEVQGLTPPEQVQFMGKYRASLQLTDEQVAHFTSAAKKQEQGRLRELLTRPGHLIQILTTFADTNTLLDTETAMLDQLLQNRLTITGRSQPPVEPEMPEKKHVVLASLALHLLACRQGQRHTRAQLLALIQQVLREHATQGTPLFPLAQATALLNDFTRNSALLREVEPEVYEFETVIWLQHLTGTALANTTIIATLKLTDTHVLDFLDKKAWDPEWEPVLMSWVGTTMDPLPFLEGLADEEHDDLARHRLGTAGRCVREVPEGHREQVAVQQLQNQIALEAVERWKAEAIPETEPLITTSLRASWVETEVGQTQMIALLDASCDDTQTQFIAAIGRLGAEMPALVQAALVRLSRNEDDDVCEAAVRALGNLGSVMAEPAQLALIERLRDEQQMVQEAARMALQRLGSAMSAAVQESLVMLLGDEEWITQRRAASALGDRILGMPTALEALMKRLTHEAMDVRISGMTLLENCLGKTMPEPIQRAICGLLMDENSEVRDFAAWLLCDLKKSMAVSAQQALVEMYLNGYENNYDLDWYCQIALTWIGQSLAPSVQQIVVERLTDADQRVRRGALALLTGQSSEVHEAVQQALLTLLTEETIDVNKRASAMRVFGCLGSAMPERVQQSLMAGLTDSDARVRAAAAQALGNLGRTMPVAVQVGMLMLLKDVEWRVRKEAAIALGELGATMSKAVQEALVRRLEDSDWSVRKSAAIALGRLSQSMPEIVQRALMARLTDEQAYVRREVVEALGWLEVTMSECIQQGLVMRLEDADNSTRWRAVEALAKLEAKMPAPVQQALVARLVDSASETQNAAFRVLGGLGVHMAGSVQQALVALLRDEDRAVRGNAAQVLSSAQQQGLRFFHDGAAVGAGRLVIELSATAPFPDHCFRILIRPRAFLLSY